jgi:hypothetical protein
MPGKGPDIAGKYPSEGPNYQNASGTNYQSGNALTTRTRGLRDLTVPAERELAVARLRASR